MALGLYIAASLGLFGIPVLGHIGTSYIGWDSNDPKFMIWCMSWWPHAVTHLTNPFHAPQMWAPSGANLAWDTSVPGLSLLAWPITASSGPVVSYNVLGLLAPALASWTAYLLCFELTEAPWPSFAGGLVFGFSPYEVGQLMNAMNLFFVALPPLAVLVVVRHAQARIRSFRFVLLLSLVLFGQFLISLEVFATMTLLGSIAMAVAFVATREFRRQLARTAGLICIAYGIVAIAASPYLYFVAWGPAPAFLTKPPNAARGSVDLLNFVTPTKLTWLGNGVAQSVSSRFTGFLHENGAYVGIPLLLIVVWFAIEQRRSVAGKVVPSVLLAAALLALGPRLKVLGKASVVMPWRLAQGIPLIGRAIPARLTLFGFLAAAVALALWLARRPSRNYRWVLAVVALAAIFPNIGVATSTTALHSPAFFTSSLHDQVLYPQEMVLVIGHGRGAPLVWQALAGMSFRMPNGHGISEPLNFRNGYLASLFISLARPPTISRATLVRFLESHEVGAIVWDAGDPPESWSLLFSSLGMIPVPLGGVLFYQVPADIAPS